MKTKIKLSVIAICTALVSLCCAFAGCESAFYELIYNDDAQICRPLNRNSYVGYYKSSVYEYTCSYYTFSGVMTLRANSFKVGSDEANVILSVTRGKLKIVLTDGSNVYTIIEQSEFYGALPLEGIPEGTYSLKIVGVKAKFKLTVLYN